MKQYNYEDIDKQVQWLIKMMDIEYPNDYELVITRNGATLKNNQMVLSFIADDLKGKVGFTNLPPISDEFIANLFKSKEARSDNPYQE